MPAGIEFPAFVKIEHKKNTAAESAFMADIDRLLGGAERRFNEFSKEAQRQVDVALSAQRNAGGSLDLNVTALQQAAAAQQARAIAAREVAAATALAAKEEGDYSKQARLTIAATEALAKEEERAAAQALAHAKAVEQVQERLNRQASGTDMVLDATKRGTEANHMMVNSVRA